MSSFSSVRLNLEFDNISDWLEYVIYTEIEVPAELEYPQFYLEIDIREQITFESSELILALHEKIKGKVLENSIWDQTIWNYPAALPDDLCFYLIENELALTALGHTRQSDKVLLVLGHLVPEAALTLGKEIYHSQDYGLEDLKMVLNEYPDLHWLWNSLIYVSASDASKKQYFISELAKRPDFDDIEATRKELEIVEEIKHSSSIATITQYYQQGTPRFLDCIAANSHTPLEMLEELAIIKNVKYAKSIRNRSRENIFKRTGKCFKP